MKWRPQRYLESVMTGSRLTLFALALLGGSTAGAAADCPRADALGTSRVMSVDPKMFPRVGLKSFPQTLPLADKEVVLTFDDGPLPATTNKVLAALAAECVQATFFLIGRNAQANPQTVKAIAAGGHTIGHHTWSHRILNRIAEPQAAGEIERGIAADDIALGGPTTPFFRFPGFASTPGLLARLEARGFAVFGADLWASDWNPMTPEQQLHLLTGRLEQDRKGIILLHDTKRQTAAMLPAFLRYLKNNNYKVVHVVAPGAAQPQPASANRFRPGARRSHSSTKTKG
jgi:peptidoglycan/xylan/chitin deacetylase (PgdA/CDA1 family)